MKFGGSFVSYLVVVVSWASEAAVFRPLVARLSLPYRVDRGRAARPKCSPQKAF